MTATKPEATKAPKNAEQELRSEITKLDRKIEAQRVHIERLGVELAEKKTERQGLVRQRIALLSKELGDEPNDL